MKSRYGLEIRTAVAADADGLCELFRLAGLAAAPRDMAVRLDAIRQAAGTALLAVEWGPPTGVVIVHWYPTLAANHPTGQVTTLLVAPDERRRGIGRLLIKAAAQAARVAGCAALELLAPPGDASIEGFCQSTGFTASGPRFARPLRKRS